MPPPSRKKRKQHPVTEIAQGNNTTNDAIRYGAMEMVAVYTGGSADDGDADENGADTVDYAFCRLLSDVLFTDVEHDGDAEIDVDWFGPSQPPPPPDQQEQPGNSTAHSDAAATAAAAAAAAASTATAADGTAGALYWPETNEQVAIGAIICAVTDQVEENDNGSIQVPAAALGHVKAKLKQQLLDEYSESDAAKHEPTYEQRIAARDKKRIKREPLPVARRRRTGANAITTKTKKAAKAPAAASRAKGRGRAGTWRLTPRPKVKLEEDIWSRTSSKTGTFSGDTYRSSKEVIRAARIGSHPLLAKLCRDKKNVADLFVQQSVSVPLTAVHYAFLNQDRQAMKLLFEDKDNTRSRAPFPECSLMSRSSGQHTSRYADYNRHKVAASRGGKEGNNAFMKDSNGARQSFPLLSNRCLVEFIANFDPPALDFLNFCDETLFQKAMYNAMFPLSDFLKSGHRELTRAAMQALVTRGVGLNDLHAQVLGNGGDDEADRLDVKRVSVTKKSAAHGGGGGARFSPIHCAAVNPRPAYVQKLLAVDPEAWQCLDSHEAGLLHYAAVSEGPDTLAWLLASHHPKFARDAKTRRPKETPLMWAARAARAKNVELLGKDVPQEDLAKQLAMMNAEGMTALHLAVSSRRSGRFDTVRALMGVGGGAAANVDVRGDTRLTDKVTPSMIAARNGDLEMLQQLHKEFGADICIADKLDRSCAIWAAMNGHVHVLSYLLKEGVDLEARDSSENNALHYAAAYGWVECVELLVQNGAHTDSRNSWSSTPLSLSLKKGAYACAAVLLKLDTIDVNVCDKTGRSLFCSLIETYLSQLSSNADAPLPWAIQRMLERDDLDVTMTDTLEKRNVLHLVAGSSTATLPTVQGLVTQWLNQFCLDPLVADIKGDVAASLALRNGNLKFVKTLFDHVSHANVSIPLSAGSSLLHLLFNRLGKGEDIELFIHVFEALRGKSEDLADEQGRTPLLLAANVLTGSCGASGKQQQAEAATWSRMKEAFEILVQKMPSHACDELERKLEFSLWKKVEKRIRDSDGAVDWEQKQEYDTDSNDCCTIFHALCSLADVQWALTMCQKMIKIIKDKMLLKKLLNRKSASSGKTPVLVVIGNFDTFLCNEKEQAALKLLELLRKNGAEMNSVLHPLFESMEDALDTGADMEVVLDTSHQSDEENLSHVRDFVVRQERARVKKKLVKTETRDAFRQTIQPYIHMLVQSHQLLEALAPHMDVNSRDLDGRTPLHVAVSRGMEKATAILIQYADVDATDAKGDCALTMAAEKGLLGVVKELLAANANVNYCSPSSGTALHTAVRRGHPNVVEVLLAKDAGCDINACDSENRTPLHYAVAAGAKSSKQELNPIEGQLLAAGADVNARDNSGRAPLSYAFVSTETDMKCGFPASMTQHDPVEMLSTMCALDGIEVDYVDEEKRTILHLAAAAGSSICVLSLTESHPKLMEVADIDGNTPVAVALLAKHWDTALLLISKGSSLEVEVTSVRRAWEKKRLVEKSRTSRSTLWHALKAQGALSTYMLSADRLPMGIILDTLLHTGSFQKALQQIRQCRDNRLLHARNKRDGTTLLHRLAQAPSFTDAPGFDVALADAIINAGVDVNDTCKRGFSVLHVAAFHGHVNLTKNLLSVRRATVDVKDQAGCTPIASVFAGNVSTAEMLCVLLEASKDARTMANGIVEGRRSRIENEKLLSMKDPQVRMFDTDPTCRRSKEAFVSRLAAEKEARKGMDRGIGSQSLDTFSLSSTPLIEAVRRNRIRMANVLLSYGAHPNACDGDGRTALHHAAMLSSMHMLALLLRWSVDSIDAVDKYGHTPLAYTVLRMLEKPSLPCLEFQILLDYGADPEAGGTLEISVRNNLLNCVTALLYSSKKNIVPICEEGKNEKKYRVGDHVWARFGGVRGSWEVATIVNREDDMLSIVPGTDVKIDSDYERRCVATQRVHHRWVCHLDHAKDVPVSANDVLVNHFKNSSVSEVDRKSLLKRRTGAENSLIGELDTSHHSVQSVISPLQVGAVVGRFTKSYSLLQIGTIVAVYQNGLYDVQLYHGELHEQLERTQLRTLRKELQIVCTEADTQLDPILVHACVRPFQFGSYENIDIMRALSDSQVELNSKDDEGYTPLDLARPGSEMQAFLRKATKKMGAGRKDAPATGRGPPPLNGIDLVQDSSAAFQALCEQGADVMEPIIPAVSDVCDLESEGVHVVKNGEDDYFDVSLTKVDVEHGRYGKYVFYKMQVIHDPVQKLNILLTNWGRIGEKGKYQQTPFSSQESCVKEFEKVFKSKTANFWSGRKAFERKSTKYSLVDTKRTRVKHPEKLLSAIVEKPSTPCSLESSLAETLRSLLDVDMIQSYMRHSVLDQSQLPIGHLSDDTLDKAELKLREIKQRIDENVDFDDVGKVRSGLESVAKLTSQFYELLPIGDQVVRPFQKNDNRFREAVELIRVLRDVSVTKQLLLGALYWQEKLNPVDYAYKALQVRMESLMVGSKEREVLERYIDSTCTDEGVLVNQIFVLDSGQANSNSVRNRRLLFHGSKNLNVLGILKQGLRIAPPEAPTTGFMYGKGVYFADQFSKAFSYSSGLSTKTNDLQPRAYVFVAEVAMGVPHVALQPEYMESPKDGTHSTIAPAPRAPDAALDVAIDSTGTFVPLGSVQERNDPKLAQFTWTSGRSWRDVSPEDSKKIERVRTSPSTSFPARVRVSIQTLEYEVLLESPFSKEVTATEAKETTKDDSDDPDMSVFKQSNQGIILRREPQKSQKSYSEFIVYKTEQIRLKYLIEVTSSSWVKREFERKEQKDE